MERTNEVKRKGNSMRLKLVHLRKKIQNTDIQWAKHPLKSWDIKQRHKMIADSKIRWELAVSHTGPAESNVIRWQCLGRGTSESACTLPDTVWASHYQEAFDKLKGTSQARGPDRPGNKDVLRVKYSYLCQKGVWRMKGVANRINL